MKLKHVLGILTLCGAVVAASLFFKGCGGDIGPEQPSNSAYIDSLKAEIAKMDIEKDSLLVIAKKKDSVRVEYVTKWRKLKGDTAYLPCDSILPQIVNLCDSIIYVDSSQISTLKKVIKTDSSIISNYKKVVKDDSITIVNLNKEIKKHKKHKRWLGIGLGVAAGVAIIK